MRRPYYLPDVTTLELDRDKCSGCGTCTQVCPQAVMALEGGAARIVNRDACMECGACAKNCRKQALFVRAGVGCANAIINSALGRSQAACCSAPETGR